MTLLTILLLAVVTFGSRYLFVHPGLPLKLRPKMVKFLSFSAPAVLTAIWVPIIFFHDNQFLASIKNPYLWGAIAAIIVAHQIKNLYLTIAAGVAIFLFTKMIF